MEKIKLGISACLLGEMVRYDGEHKLDHYLRDTLGKFIEWVPVCPEVECGLSIPREEMQLEGDVKSPRLLTKNTRIDYTDKMLSWANKRLKELEKEKLCGFVFKARSPSSGMQSVKVYNKKGIAVKKGVGIFANLFIKKFPYIPVEEDDRLHNPVIRESFIERIYIYKKQNKITI